MNLCIDTVCGGGLDYEFLLGAIQEHSILSTRHVVYDVTPHAERRVFRKLPSSVAWVQATQDYAGGNWHTFRSRAAVVDAHRLAVETAQRAGCDVLARLDCDEFMSARIGDVLPLIGRDKGLEHYIVHYTKDLRAYYKKWGYARRICGVDVTVDMPLNAAWQRCPDYDGNPERHMIPIWKSPRVRTDVLFHHHLHYAFPQKGCATAFSGWEECPSVPLPDLLREWKEKGRLPSEEFL